MTLSNMSCGGIAAASPASTSPFSTHPPPKTTSSSTTPTNEPFWTPRHQRVGSHPHSSNVSATSTSSDSPDGDITMGSLMTTSAPSPSSNSLPMHTTPNGAISHSQSRQRLQNVWMEKKAKKLKFYRNGDKFKGPVLYAFSIEKTRGLDSLFSDLTRILSFDSVALPLGVRYVFRVSDGKPIKQIEDFEEGECYVCSSTDQYIQMDYQNLSTPKHFQTAGVNTGEMRNSLSLDYSLRVSYSMSNRDKSLIRPRLVRVLRAGNKPRKFVRLLLNKKTAHSIEQVFDDLSRIVQLDSGAVRKVFSINGAPILSLGDFFTCPDNVFVAYGKEQPTNDDFLLTDEESRKLECSQMRRETRFYEKPKRGHSSNKRNGSATEIRARARREGEAHYPAALTREYDIHNKIGDGNFATVYECRHKTSDKWFALKVIDQTKCKGKEMLVKSEVEVLQRVKHANIVELLKQIPSPETEELYLVMELVPGGDLFDAISQANQFSEDQSVDLMQDLGSALIYLHSLNIVHRDIKPENLLVVPETQCDRMRLKLADFGLAVEITNDEPLYTVCGTPTYVAPEILSETGYGLKVDIWACGVIMYILLCGFPPFSSDNNSQEELFDKILAGEFEFTSPYFDLVSNAARDLIEKMLQVDSNTRYSAQQMIEHPWMKTQRCASPDSAMSMSTESMHFERKPTTSQTDSATSSL